MDDLLGDLISSGWATGGSEVNPVNELTWNIKQESGMIILYYA